jgi:hypothetical protein
MWYGATPKGQLVLANFGASENCIFLLCFGGWCRLEHEKLAKGQVRTCNVVLVGSVCQLTSLSVSNLQVTFLPVWSFYLYFKEPNNAYLQEEVRLEQHTPWHTATRSESWAKPWKVKKERSEGFSDSFSYFGNTLQQGTRCWRKKWLTSSVTEHRVNWTHPAQGPSE